MPPNQCLQIGCTAISDIAAMGNLLIQSFLVMRLLIEWMKALKDFKKFLENQFPLIGGDLAKGPCRLASVLGKPEKKFI